MPPTLIFRDIKNKEIARFSWKHDILDKPLYDLLNLDPHTQSFGIIYDKIIYTLNNTLAEMCFPSDDAEVVIDLRASNFKILVRFENEERTVWIPFLPIHNNCSFKSLFDTYFNHQVNVLWVLVGLKVFPGNDYAFNMFPLSCHDVLEFSTSLPVCRSEVPTIDNEAKAALNEYHAIGATIMQSNSYREIFDVLQEVGLRGMDINGTPTNSFIFVSAPSLSGKSQFAMAVEEQACYKSWSLDRSQDAPFSFVLYFVLAKVKFRNQPIYNASTISRAFLKHLRKDFNDFSHYISVANADSDSDLDVDYDQELKSGSLFSCSTLANSKFPFRILGFICEIMTKLKSGKTLANLEKIEFKPLTVLQARAMMIKLCLDQKPAVVFNDEFNTAPIDGISKCPKEILVQQMLCLARNVQRAAGFCTCVMGTDSNALNLFQKLDLGDQISREGDNPFPWVYLVKTLPAANLTSLAVALGYTSGSELDSALNHPKLKSLRSWLLPDGNLICSYRPGFLLLFFKLLLSEANGETETCLEILEAAFSRCLNVIKQWKKSLRTEAGLYGQFAMLFDRYRQNENPGLRTYPAELIHRHFAFLNIQGMQDESIIRLERKSFEGKVTLGFAESSEEVLINSCFPQFSLDEVGFFILLSTFRDEKPFQTDSDKLSFIQVAQAQYSSGGPLHESWKGDLNNLKPLRRNPAYLEAIALGSVVMASHNSFSGIKLSEFLEQLTYQLSPKLEAVFDEKSIQILGGFRDVLVPYVPAIGATCSDAFQGIPAVFTGSIRHTHDKENCDGIMLPDIVLRLRAACNRSKHPVTIDDIRKILLVDENGDLGPCIDLLKDEEIVKALLKLKKTGLLEECLFDCLTAYMIECKNFLQGIGASILCSVCIRFALITEIQYKEGFINRSISFLFASKFQEVHPASIRALQSQLPGLRMLLLAKKNNQVILSDLADTVEPQHKRQQLSRAAKTNAKIVLAEYLEIDESEGAVIAGSKQGKGVSAKIDRKIFEKVPGLMIVIDVESIFGQKLAATRFHIPIMEKAAIIAETKDLINSISNCPEK